MVAKSQSSAKTSPAKALVARLNKECSQNGLFVGSAGSVSIKEGERIFIGPSPNQVRSVDVDADAVFDLGIDDNIETLEPKGGGVKVHDMTKIHLDIYKENASIGCIVECRSTSSIVASLMIKGKNLSVTDPSIVLGPNPRTAPVNIPLVDGSSDLEILSERILQHLKKKLNRPAKPATAAPAAAQAPKAETVQPKKEEPAVEGGAEEADVESSVLGDELEIEIKPDEKDLDDEASAEAPQPVVEEPVDLDEMFCNAVIIRNKGFIVWAKTWTECMNRAEQINQMLEICNQMKLMGFNVYSHIMVAATQKHRLKRTEQAANKEQDNTVSDKSVSESEQSGPTAHKRPRIEAPKPEPDEVASETPTKPTPTPTSESKPIESSEKKRKWFNKQRGQGPKHQQQQQQHHQPQQQPKLALTTRKNRPAEQASNTGLQRPATNRFSPQGRGARHGGQQPPRMAQVPSPWAVAPQAANPWFGKF